MKICGVSICVQHLNSTYSKISTNNLHCSPSDCHINHYLGHWWEDLEELEVAQYYAILGWNIDSWDEELYIPETEDMYWDELTSEQQQAAGQLCFSKELWDRVPLPWKVLATITQEAGSTQPTLFPSPSSPTPLPYCPPRYSTNNTYAAGDYVSIKNKQLDQTGIFQCNNEPGYEMYCNIHEWDDALLDENESAQDMWNNAWVPISECHDTQTPTGAPSMQPTEKPVTDRPTSSPVTKVPSRQPTSSPVTDSPSKRPITHSPTTSPTLTTTEQPSLPPTVASPALPVNPVATKRPEKRYVAWSLLNDDDKTVATVNLEYDQSVSFLTITYQFSYVQPLI